MNEEVSKEDQDWLNALAGKSPVGIDTLLSTQALAVREALKTRREAIESDVIHFGDSGLNEIRAQLQREGLMVSLEIIQVKKAWWVREWDIFGFGSNGVGAKIATFLAKFLFGGSRTEESLVYRGDPNKTILIVENPELRANEMVAGIKAVTADGVAMNILKDGRIELQIKDLESVRDYLLTQRIEATEVKGMITIEIIQKKK
ncbi:MAG: hypothetical protein Q7T62_02050 [Undibacterium sp.]|nr:hypothetical protein [Undibacterium sp.]